MAENVLEFSDDNFETEVIGRSEPVLVDFWAPWCGPCKMIAPTIEALAEEYAGKVRVGKVNTDQNTKTAVAYQISGIPTLILFKNGEVVERFTGVTPKNALTAKLDKHL